MIRLFLRSVCIMFIGLMSCKDDDADATPVISGFTPTRGMVGTEVTISGNRFDGEVTVEFNGAPAEILNKTTKTILVTVPQGAMSGPITVKVGDNTLVTPEDFTVLLAVAEDPAFLFGADLSYVNQILDKGGVYKENGAVKDPYEIFSDRGTDLVRLRLWHNPAWTKDVYPDGQQLYNDFSDVAVAIERAKAQGMRVLLDFHYSDVWADPGTQNIPAAWKDIKELSVLRDSVYNYTKKTLQRLNEDGLMPEFVQIGNETNCGMLYEYEDAPVAGFPACNACNGQWSNLAAVVNSAIKAVRDVSEGSAVKPRIALHVADPVNVPWWFDNIAGGGAVTDFDIIGFSYYPLWHTGVPLDQLSDRIASFMSTYDKDVMILETAYPWGTSGNDGYNNIFGSQPAVTGYPFTPQGQLNMMKKITQEVVDGGGIGLVYWEPAWITSDLHDLWNTGSSWENCTFFDFQGEILPVMDYMTDDYQR